MAETRVHARFEGGPLDGKQLIIDHPLEVYEVAVFPSAISSMLFRTLEQQLDPLLPVRTSLYRRTAMSVVQAYGESVLTCVVDRHTSLLGAVGSN